MRVAHIITRMIVGGAQENTLLNCLDLQNVYGDDVLLITGPALGPEGDLLGQGRAVDLKTQVIPSLVRAIDPRRDWLALRAIGQQLRDFKPDVVHTHSAKGGILGRQAAFDAKTAAIVHTVHGAPFHEYQSWPVRTFYRWCETRAAKQCDRLICVADAMTDLLVESQVAPLEKFKTIYSGMEIEPFVRADEHRSAMRQQLGLSDQDIVVGKIARLFHLKGHADVIEAASQIVKACPNVKFLLVGDGVLRQALQDQICAAGLEQHFIFTGLVAPEKIPAYIGAMDLLLHASYREGLARALPQALLAGKPAISYDIDGAREVVIDDQTGYLVTAGDTHCLARRVIELAGDTALRDKLGKQGRALCKERFCHLTMTAQIRSLYLQILDSPRAPLA